MAKVSLRDVTKAFGLVEIIKGASLDIAHGEFVALVGPSGSGKSTLLRMIAGLEDVSGGTIEISGRIVNDVPAKDRDIAMVFQNYALYPHMTVAQNLAFALRMRKMERTEIDRRVADTAASLDLTHLLDRYPRQLSGGQRQRVATGRAIVREPQVFLFDEPLSNLDARLRVQVRAELRELHRRMGVTSIYVTHDQVEAMTMADRIVVLRDGIIEQVGSPLELYDRPTNIFVATFIGSPAMNLIEGVCDGRSIELAGGSLPVPGRLGVKPGTPMTVGTRPEDIELVADGSGAMTGRLVAMEATGAETIALLDLSGCRITVVSRERLSANVGDTMHIRPAPGKLHFFDAGGRRIATADGAA